MDKYQKVKVLGKGSFGSAILIKRKADGLLFVVKEVSLMKMSKKERDEARHECTVLQQLQHPNIVRYVEQFENKNNLYIVMEYCDGGDLAGKVKLSRGPMKESSVLYYFSQICLAMEYLHARHILHRDIKTMNVFLMKNGAVKLGDFGISTVLRNTMGMANTVCGTPYYFSPELCRNRPYNNKSDIWALGVLLYECATGGRHPFDGTSMNQLMQRIVKGNYAPLSSQYSPDFRKMVDWCLQKEPARRPSIKQTLALPLMRQSLEQLEENLMLATQCRVRLKDIIDFESAMDQAERPKSPQPAPVSPRPAAKEGISPGQAAALALAQHPTPQPTGAPYRSPAASPRSGAAIAAAAAAAVVGPKPSAQGPQQNNGAAPNRAYDVHHFYNPYQRKAEANPIVAERPGGRADVQAPPPPSSPPQQQQQQQQQQQRYHSPTAEVSPRAQSPRSNVNFGNGGGGAAAQSPPNGAADPFHADMRRVDAIIAKYGRNTDERAKETIHAYMRRKQEAYLKKQKEELESRERRNDMRQRELKRVLENQRAAVSPTNANHAQRDSPRSTDPVSANGGRHTPQRRLGSPQSRARSEDLQPHGRSPVLSPSRASPATPRSPASPAAGGGVGGVFGRDPRRNGVGQQQQQRSRPTTPQRPYAPPSQRGNNVAAVSPKPSANGPSRKVVVAANSPQPGQIEHHAGAAGARRPQSPSQLTGQHAEMLNIDWRALANAKQANSPTRRKKAPAAAGLDEGIGGHKMLLQPAQPPAARHSQEPHRSPSSRDSNSDALRRPSVLAPLSNEAQDHRSPRKAMSILGSDLLSRAEGNASPEAVSPRAAGDPRLQRPNRVHQGYLKPLNGRGDEQFSPAQSPVLGMSPRLDALPIPERHFGGASPSNSPRAQAGRPNGRSASPAVELVDIPRSVAANSPAPTSSTAGGPVEEALRILRRRRLQTGAAGVSGSAEVKDVPTLNLSPAEVGAARRQPSRHYADDGASYAGMSREAVRQDDARFLAEEQLRRRKAEESAVPNTLEALRSLRGPSDHPAPSGGTSAESEAYPVGQLALLKQRHHMRQNGAANMDAAVPASSPNSAAHSTDGAWPAAKSDPIARREKRPYSSRSSPPPASSAPVTALSLGDVGRNAPHSASPTASPKASKQSTPRTSNVGAGSGGGAQQGSMDGYTEMLQHLKDLLQRRRVTRATGSSASTPTAIGGAAAPRPAAESSSPNPVQQRRLPLPPPLDSLPSADNGPHRAELVALSPPNLNATKPLHRLRNLPPALDLPVSDEAADAADDDEDFEDAVPLSPVRCAELNDTYARLQQQQQQKKKKGGRAVPDDVYTNDVDLTSANMEEELDGEEGYTGYYKLPSPQELLKGN